MTPTEAKTLLVNLLSEATASCEIAKTAARNGKSLAGHNRYAERMHASIVALTTTESKLRSALAMLELPAADLDPLCLQLLVLKDASAKYDDRASALRQLELVCKAEILHKLEGMAPNPVPATQQVLSMAVVNPTRRRYLTEIVQQANGCYEHAWYDACAVLIRRLVETLIIEVYEAKGATDDIKLGDGNFFMLKGLVENILGKTAWGLSRETKVALPLLKSLGDRSAHSRRYLAKKDDIDKVLPGLRVVAEDLILLADLR